MALVRNNRVALANMALVRNSQAARVNMALVRNNRVALANIRRAILNPPKVLGNIRLVARSNRAQRLIVPALAPIVHPHSPIARRVAINPKGLPILKEPHKSNASPRVKNAKKNWPLKLHCPKFVPSMSRWISGIWLKSCACATPKSSSTCS